MRMPSIGGIPLPAILVVVAIAAFIFGPRFLTTSSGSNSNSLQNVPGLNASSGASQQEPPAGGEVAVDAAAVEAAGAHIEPGQVAAGDVVMTLTLTDARHMFDAATGSATPGQQQQDDSEPSRAGIAVLDGLMRKATNNIDSSQKVAADPADGKGPLVRHVVLTMKQKDTGELLPYAEVTMDILRNGRPVLYDQALIPSVAVNDESVPAGLHYGNNVALPGKGNYQMFVRVAPNPFLGDSAPPAAQFNVTFE